MRVQKNTEDIGRCGCGRREYCDGSHGLSNAQWQALQASEQAAARQEAEKVSEAEIVAVKPARSAPAGSARR
jgi:hypothetical protein